MDLLWPRRETLWQLQEHFGTDSREAVLQALGVDLRWIDVPVRYPDHAERVNGVLEGDAPGAGRAYIFRDRQTFEDEWGVVQRVGDDGKYLEWKSGPLVCKETLEGWSPPRAVYPPLDTLRQELAAHEDFMTVTEVAFPFKIAWHMCSYAHFLTMMALQPEFVEQLYDHLYAFQTRHAVYAAEAGVDIIAIVGDIAGQIGMMFSPKMLERFDVPRLTRLIQATKAANPGVKVLYHSDGAMTPAIPCLIRCGIDILNPIQSACMDAAAVKAEYGERLAFHGTISVQQTLPWGTVDDVRREVVRRIETVGYNGGLIVSPENSVPYDAPLANVLALYDTVRNYDYRNLR